MIGRASASSSFHHRWTYDVFINFRGEDTRHGFTGYLYQALTQKGVRTFFDDAEIRKGDEITPLLLKAIQESRMAIIVFSKNYASSTFCLDELVQICWSIKKKDRPVWPIFYDVEPSEVRHQKGNYEQALAIHRDNSRADEEKMQRWKLALHEVANISGIHLNPRHGQYEYQLIERIVKEISSKINRVPLYVAEYPVGLDSRRQKINSLLQLGSKDEVIMVGISGIGGMGKSTIACAVFNSIADNFEGFCFLYDIKENSKKFGLERMQERMLSKILGVDIKVEDVNEGVAIIKERLEQKKILLILDNVDEQEQLQKIAGHCDWFGFGSRIIITTRDTQLLLRHGVERIYDVKAFNYEESLELLSWNAFRNNQVDPSYKEVLNHTLCYTKGLPLAIEVIGSHLNGKRISEWESALDTYKRIPDKDIQQRLKVSYDGLNQVEKEIFLDIACFFKGSELEYVIDMVEHVHGFDPYYSIRVLVDKCLIKIEKHWISRHDCIEMHDLIQDMGREIVRQESPKEPGMHSRLWFNQDIIHVLEENTGTNEVSIIISDNLSKCIEVNWDGEAFNNMRSLKILIFENLKFSEGPKYLPNSLKVLNWKEYPSSCLPHGFCPKKLVVFQLAQSCFNSVETIKKMQNLSILNLASCKYITQIPNLSGLSGLKELLVQSCKNLIEIDDSVGGLAKLEILYVYNCTQLKTFPLAIKLPSLKEVHLIKCLNLKHFPEILGKMKITHLELVETGIEKLPSSISDLTHLRVIHIEPASGRLIELPISSIFLLPQPCEIKGPGKLVMEVSSMQCLCKNSLSLRKCNISNENLRICLTSFINVTHLDLSANDFTILPTCIKECCFLWNLNLSGCKYLREVEGIPPNIKELNARDCRSLSSESRKFLLSEELVAAVVINDFCFTVFYRACFCVPGLTIPAWFDHSSKGGYISFWFRNSFPTLCVCALLIPFGNPYLSPTVFINKKPACLSVVHLDVGLGSDDDHIAVFDLKGDYFDDDDMKRGFQEGEWNHVEVFIYSCPIPGAIMESGIYVIKQLSSMPDIRFTDPFERLDFVSDDQGNALVPLLSKFNLEQKSLLRDLLESQRACLYVPGSSIPEWFNHSNKGASISFWFRNSFPTLFVCALLKWTDHLLQRNKPLGAGRLYLAAALYIDHEQVCETEFWAACDENVDYMVVYGQKWDYFLGDKRKRAFLEGEWNQAEVHTYSDFFQDIVKESGIYVCKQNCSMEDIRFTDPYQKIDSMSGGQEEVRKHFGPSTQKKESMLNQKIPLTEDDDVASFRSLIPFRCTKRRRNCLILNQDENNANTTEINSTNASETINNQEAEKEERFIRSRKEPYGNFLRVTEYESKMKTRDAQSLNSRANEELVHVNRKEENKEDREVCQTQYIKEQEDEALISNQISESLENVIKSDDITEVKCQNYIFDSNGNNLTWDPMECEYQMTCHHMDPPRQRRDPWLRLLCVNLFTFVASLCSS